MGSGALAWNARLAQTEAMSERIVTSSTPLPLRKVRVWDLPTRLFHWALVVLVAFSWWSGEQGDSWLKWHFWSGYSILTLLLFRLAWGFVGSATARFSGFLRGPAAGIAHLRELAGKHEPRDLGHNAVGGWMVIALIAVLLAQAITGLFADDEILMMGPLAELVSAGTRATLSTIHGLLINVILALVALHVLAVLAYWALRGQNLIRPMLSGDKAVPQDIAARPPAMVSPLRALAIVVLAALIVWAIVSLG